MKNTQHSPSVVALQRRAKNNWKYLEDEISRREEVRKGLQHVRMGIASIGETSGLNQPKSSLQQLVNYADTAVSQLLTTPTNPPAQFIQNQTLVPPQLGSVPITTPPANGGNFSATTVGQQYYPQIVPRDQELVMRSPIESIAAVAVAAAEAAMKHSPLPSYTVSERNEAYTVVATAAATAAASALLQYNTAHSSRASSNTSSRATRTDISNSSTHVEQQVFGIGGENVSATRPGNGLAPGVSEQFVDVQFVDGRGREAPGRYMDSHGTGVSRETENKPAQVFNSRLIDASNTSNNMFRESKAEAGGGRDPSLEQMRNQRFRAQPRHSPGRRSFNGVEQSIPNNRNTNSNNDESAIPNDVDIVPSLPVSHNSLTYQSQPTVYRRSRNSPSATLNLRAQAARASAAKALSSAKIARKIATQDGGALGNLQHSEKSKAASPPRHQDSRNMFGIPNIQQEGETLEQRLSGMQTSPKTDSYKSFFRSTGIVSYERYDGPSVASKRSHKILSPSRSVGPGPLLVSVKSSPSRLGSPSNNKSSGNRRVAAYRGSGNRGGGPKSKSRIIDTHKQIAGRKEPVVGTPRGPINKAMPRVKQLAMDSPRVVHSPSVHTIPDTSRGGPQTPAMSGYGLSGDDIGGITVKDNGEGRLDEEEYHPDDLAVLNLIQKADGHTPQLKGGKRNRKKPKSTDRKQRQWEARYTAASD